MPSSVVHRLTRSVCGLLLASAAVVVAPGIEAAEAGPSESTSVEQVSGPDDRSIERLYLAYLGRYADGEGLAYWTQIQANGQSLELISEQFASSPEFFGQNGQISDRDYVVLVYQNVLDRAPEDSGLNHWTAQLESGAMTRGAVMLGFSDSAEYKVTSGLIEELRAGSDGRSIERLYKAYFLRDADASGLSYWHGQEDHGRTLVQISDFLAESDEFVERYGELDSEEFVSLIYLNVLGRAPEAGGLAFWTVSLELGSLSRGDVMLGFADGLEFKTSTGLVGARPAPPTPVPRPTPEPGELPQAGNPQGNAVIPAAAQAVDTTTPDHVVGSGTPQSCTSAAVVAAVAQGGTITFDCGTDPLTIVMTETAKVRNDRDPDVIIDGGGLITLSGGSDRRILYMNTCDPDQVWTTSHCQNQDHPRLTVQNLNFVDGDATGETAEGGGGGAIFVRGGRLKIVNSVFARNRCDGTGPDVGGAAVRAISQFDGLPVYVVNSTFGGAAGQGNICSNGGGLSSIGTSYTVLNSLFTHNEAIGNGANPAQQGTPGGGLGAAIYNDGGFFELIIRGTVIEDNVANEAGAAVFFVSNSLTGHLIIEDSQMQRNSLGKFGTNGFPGIFYLGDGPIQVQNSSIT